MESALKLHPNRNYGIDALRLTSMFFVVILHILGQGGILKNTDGTAYNAAWLLEIVAYCAVDCYAIISGFVAYSDVEKPYHYSKYIRMWLMVFLYSFGTAAYLYFFGTEPLTAEQLWKYATPVTSKTYWYFTAYTVLFFFIPYFNKAMRALTKKQATCLVALLGLFFSLLEFKYAPFELKKGYSFCWLAALYLVGAWLKKCAVPAKIKGHWALPAFAASTALTWLVKLKADEKNADLFVSYVSPTIVLNAIALVIVFSKLRLGRRTKGAIAFLSPAAFGVYILHEHPLLIPHFKDWFGWLSAWGWKRLTLGTLGCAAAMLVACLAVEKLRLLLFRLLRIDALTDALFDRSVRFARRVFHRR